MKKFLWIIVLAAIIFLGFQNRTAVASTVEKIVYYSPCATPRTYSIGSIDPRFNITQADFLSAAETAANIWKNGDGTVLFTYDPKSKLPISFVYDERQYLNTQVSTLNNQVENQKNSLKPEIADYEQRAANFKKRNADLNARVEFWNNKGGAPQDEYNTLIAEQQSLQQEAQQLQSIAESLNQTTDQYNTQVQQLDQQVDAYNNTLEVKPEEGEYIRKGGTEKIVLYFNNSRAELIHTLAHEMGHAIEMPHNNNPLSIMHPKTSLITKLSNADLTDLTEVCRKKSILEIAKERFAIATDVVKQRSKNLLKGLQFN